MTTKQPLASALLKSLSVVKLEKHILRIIQKMEKPLDMAHLVEGIKDKLSQDEKLLIGVIYLHLGAEGSEEWLGGLLHESKKYVQDPTDKKYPVPTKKR
jgi:hypothetical protein